MLLKRFGNLAAFCGSVVRGLTSATLTATVAKIRRRGTHDGGRYPPLVECEAIIERLYPELERRLAKGNLIY